MFTFMEVSAIYKMRLEKREELGLDLYFLSFYEHMPSGWTALVGRDSADKRGWVGRSGVGMKKERAIE